ncbi:MAG: hypothetical protein R3B48_06355 [Kofleriaceae bacterium]
MSTHGHQHSLDTEPLAAAEQRAARASSDRLPHELALRVQQLQPGDPQALAALVQRYPAFADAILAEAAGQVGNRTVAAALELVSSPSEASAGASAPSSAPRSPRPPQISYDPSTFDYLNSEASQEGGDPIETAVQFLQREPQLRAQVLAGFAKEHPRRIDELRERLREHGGGARAAVPAAPTRRPRPPQISYDPSTFDYLNSEASQEGGDPIGTAVQFLQREPQLRAQVLEGFAKEHPGRIEELMTRLREREGPAVEREQTEREAEQGGPSPATEAAPEAGKESAWVTRAQRFNAAHPEDVAEFNRVTKDACVGGDGVVDPALVSDWQLGHGLSPDGRVGPQTVDAARRAAGIGHPIPMRTAEDCATA